jgi:translation initiation factor 1
MRAPQIDKKKIVKALKGQLSCNGSINEDPEFGEVIQVQGDQVK